MTTTAPSTPSTPSDTPPIAFIGGGNMASALMGGLLQQGLSASQIEVVEPYAGTRASLHERFGLAAHEAAGPQLARARLVVWAVKPQVFAAAAEPVRAHAAPGALHLSVAAGITTDSIARWLGTEAVVRAMPNTPALVGKGMTGLFARAQVDEAGRALVEQVLRPTGQTLWVQREDLLDAVTALSGSGPAYVFLFLEAMTRAGIEMGLPPEQAHRLAVGTFQGASELAARAEESPEVLRQRVTSPGGTTHAAITHLQGSQVPEHFIAAMHAAQARAKELATEFGGEEKTTP